MAPVGSSFFAVPPVVLRGPEPELIAVWLVGGARPTTQRARALSIDRRAEAT
jgi:hypothetical protein